MSTDWRTTIEQRREQKDHYFGENPRSPIPDDERESFEGMSCSSSTVASPEVEFSLLTSTR